MTVITVLSVLVLMLVLMCWLLWSQRQHEHSAEPPVISPLCHHCGKGVLGHHWSLHSYRPRAYLLTEMIITLLINVTNYVNPAQLANRKQTEDLFSPARIPDLQKLLPRFDVTILWAADTQSSVVVKIALGSERFGFVFWLCHLLAVWFPAS